LRQKKRGRMTKSKTVQITEIKKDIQHLTIVTEKGFREVHRRQDVANGKLLKHENKLIKIESNIGNIGHNYLTKEEFNHYKIHDLKRKISAKDKLVWYLAGLAATVVVAILLKVFGG